MADRIRRWIEDRIPLSSMIGRALDEEIPGGSRYAYTLGSATLFVFGLQALTGLWQLFYYVPSVDHAYDSVNFLRTEVPFGWLIHNLHYWGANAMIVLVGLHIARVFLFGAYKAPRELTWLAGVVLLLVTAGIVFTGAPLPWDEPGYWAAEVGTSIAGTVPVFGNAVKALLRGGDVMGPLALSRMFVLHVAILPGTLAVFLAVHLIAFRRFGSVGPWDEGHRNSVGAFWPDQAFKDTVVAASLLLLLFALCVFAPPPVAGPADPLDTSFVPKPEWNFLFLYETLKFLPGRLEPLGTVGIPAVGVLILILLPFLDRNPQRNPRRRPLAMAGGAIWVGFVVSFTIIGYLSHPEGVGGTTGPAPSGSPATLSPSARAGSRLVASLGCNGCHSINGVGGAVGPDLSDESARGRSREWLAAQVRNPKSHDPNTIMPSYATLDDTQVNQIVDYLMSLGEAAPTAVERPAAPARPPSAPAPGTPGVVPTNPALPPPPVHGAGTSSEAGAEGPPGPAASIIGSAEHGATLFRLYCAGCHGQDGKGGVANPGSEGGVIPALTPIRRAFFDRDPEIFATNIDRILQHGAIPKGPLPQKNMLVFGKTHSLSQEEIADLEAYILYRNGVERAQLKHPGIPPQTYFAGVAAAFLVAAAGLWGYAAHRKRRRRA
jgi:quinol-cytochrome oxidoreductase complex cytochrome b subunit/mono/diheme cytochrome c family protein